MKPKYFSIVIYSLTFCFCTNKRFVRFLQIERGKLDKGGYSSLQSMGSIGKMDSGFGNDSGISSGGNFGSGSGFGLTSDVDSFSTKSKGQCLLLITLW